MKIVEISNKKQFNQFLNFPKYLYYDVLKDDKFVMPLKMVSKITIGNLKNPRLKLLLAMRDGKIIARLGVLKHKSKGETKLHWGFYECMPNEIEATKFLFEYAHNLHPELEMIGPYSFQMEDPYMGLLVSGFQHDPYFMMAYNPEYYNDFLVNAGLEKAMDVYTYNVIGTTKLNPHMIERAQKCAEEGVQLRTINPKKMKEEIRTIARIFNDALKDNWGFEEMIDSQIKDMYAMFKLFVNPDVVFFAHKDGVDLGCLIMLPNFNPTLKKAKGKITLGLLWDVMTKKKKQETCRGYALGVLQSAHGQGIGNFLVKNGWDICTGPVGYKGGEISWILSDNGRMNHLTEQLDSSVDKVYRVLTKPPLK